MYQLAEDTELLTYRQDIRDLLSESGHGVPALTPDDGPANIISADVTTRLHALLNEHGGRLGRWQRGIAVAEALGQAAATTSLMVREVLTPFLAERLGYAPLGGDTLVVPAGALTADGLRAPEIDPKDRRIYIPSVFGTEGAGAFLLAVRGGPTRLVRMSVATTTSVCSLDLTRPLVDLGFAGLGDVLAEGPEVDAALEVVHPGILVILAADQLGVAERAVAVTAEHLRQREQFGRPLGSFQALKHRMADIWISIRLARATLRYAAACLENEDHDLTLAAHLAFARTSDAALAATKEAVQMHGAYGFSWAAEPHILLKRAKASSLTCGSPAVSRERIAELVQLR